MAQLDSPVKVLEHCLVSPPPGFKPQPFPPLTFFDLFWLSLPPVERLFFYSYHHTNDHFIDTALPNLKQSLSLTLQHFYPLAGTLTWPVHSLKPQILCSEDDCVTLTIAESNLSFNNLVGNHPRNVNEFFGLVPQISQPDAQVEVEVPLMALQVTLFPNAGICIGISTLHVVGDGKTTSHFMKSWAAVCKSGLGDTSYLVPESLPFYDRNVISDPDNIETICLNVLKALNLTPQCFYKQKIPAVKMDKVRATFVMSLAEIKKLKGLVIDRVTKIHEKDSVTPPPLHLSSFALTCAFVWVCLVKAFTGDEVVNEMEREDLVFAVDCRERLNPPIPPTYFGNCLLSCFVDMKRNEMIGEDGISFAATAIAKAIQRMVNDGVLTGAENLFTKAKYLSTKQRILSIAGSPKLGVYGTDFGWGRPKKVEVVSIDTGVGAGAISLSECRDGEGGLEIGLVLNKLQMDSFSSLFTNTLSILS